MSDAQSSDESDEPLNSGKDDSNGNIFDQFDDVNVFKARDTLRDSYIPNKIEHRKEQQNNLAAKLSDAAYGGNPSSAVLVGPNGTGKTVVSRDVINQLQQKAESMGHNVAYFHVDCSPFTSEYQVATKAVNKIFDHINRKKIKPTGYSEPQVIQKLFDTIENELESETVILVLDDLGRVEDINDILYQVTRPGQPDTALETTDVSVVCTANDMKFRRNFRRDIKSSFEDEDFIEFPSYKANELFDILEKRAEKAFSDGMISEPPVRLTAALAGVKGGDARYGLQILAKAGEIIKSGGDEVVTEDTIYTAQRRIDKSSIRSELITQNERSQLVVAAVGLHAIQYDSWPSITETYEYHKALMKKFDLPTYSREMVYKRISLFEEMELLSKNYSPNQRGKKVKLTYPPERYIEACDEKIVGKITDDEFGIISESALAETTTIE